MGLTVMADKLVKGHFSYWDQTGKINNIWKVPVEGIRWLAKSKDLKRQDSRERKSQKWMQYHFPIKAFGNLQADLETEKVNRTSDSLMELRKTQGFRAIKAKGPVVKPRPGWRFLRAYFLRVCANQKYTSLYKDWCSAWNEVSPDRIKLICSILPAKQKKETLTGGRKHHPPPQVSF